MTRAETGHYYIYIFGLMPRHKYQQNKHIRQVNKQSLDVFIKDLDKQSWENTLISNDVNTAYNSFLDLFIELYDKNCPLNILKDYKNMKTSKPWFTTNGLRNACIRENVCTKITLKTEHWMHKSSTNQTEIN